MNRLKDRVRKTAALAFEKTGLDIIAVVSHPGDIARGIPAISSVSLDTAITYKSAGKKSQLRRNKSVGDGGEVTLKVEGEGESDPRHASRPPAPRSRPPQAPIHLLDTERGKIPENLTSPGTGEEFPEISTSTEDSEDPYWEDPYDIEESEYIEMSTHTITVQEAELAAAAAEAATAAAAAETVTVASEGAAATTVATVTTNTTTIATATTATATVTTSTAATATFSATVDPDATTLLDTRDTSGIVSEEMDQFSELEGAAGGGGGSESHENIDTIESILYHHGVVVPMTLLVYRDLESGLKKYICEVVGVGSLQGLINNNIVYDDSLEPEVALPTSTPIASYMGADTPKRPMGRPGDPIRRTSPKYPGFDSPAFSLEWDHEKTGGANPARSRFSMRPLSAGKHLYPSHEVVQTLMEPLLTNKGKPDLAENVKRSDMLLHIREAENGIKLLEKEKDSHDLFRVTRREQEKWLDMLEFYLNFRCQAFDKCDHGDEVHQKLYDSLRLLGVWLLPSVQDTSFGVRDDMLWSFYNTTRVQRCLQMEERDKTPPNKEERRGDVGGTIPRRANQAPRGTQPTQQPPPQSSPHGYPRNTPPEDIRPNWEFYRGEGAAGGTARGEGAPSPQPGHPDRGAAGGRGRGRGNPGNNPGNNPRDGQGDNNPPRHPPPNGGPPNDPPPPGGGGNHDEEEDEDPRRPGRAAPAAAPGNPNAGIPELVQELRRLHVPGPRRQVTTGTTAEYDRLYRESITTMGYYTGQAKGDRTGVSRHVDLVIDDIEHFLAYFDNWQHLTQLPPFYVRRALFDRTAGEAREYVMPYQTDRLLGTAQLVNMLRVRFKIPKNFAEVTQMKRDFTKKPGESIASYMQRWGNILIEEQTCDSNLTLENKGYLMWQRFREYCTNLELRKQLDEERYNTPAHLSNAIMVAQKHYNDRMQGPWATNLTKVKKVEQEKNKKDKNKAKTLSVNSTTSKANDVCLSCGQLGHWSRTCVNQEGMNTIRPFKPNTNTPVPQGAQTPAKCRWCKEGHPSDRCFRMMRLAQTAGLPGAKASNPPKGRGTPADAARPAGVARGRGYPRGRGRGRGRGQARVNMVYEEEQDPDQGYGYDNSYEEEEYLEGEDSQDPLN